MSTGEQIWFIIGVSGFLFVLEGGFNFIIKTITKGKTDNNLLKAGFGVFIFILALIVLFNLT